MGTMLTAAKLEWLTSRRDAKIQSLMIAEEAYDDLLAQQAADSSINTGEGSSRILMVRIKDQDDVISTLDAEIRSLSRKISGRGDIQYMTLRRKR